MIVRSRSAPPVVVRRGRAAYQQAAGLDPRRHLGQRVLRRLLVDQPCRRTARAAGPRPGWRRARPGAMPTANAPTLGRNRSSVRIATAEPLVDLAEHVVARDADPVEVERAERVRGDHVEPLAGEPGCVAGDRERGDPARPACRASCGRRRSRRRHRGRWRSRSSCRAASSRHRPAAPRGTSAPASEPASGSERANAGTTSPLATPGIQRSRVASLPDWRIG